MRSLSNASMAALAAIVTIGASGFAVAAAATSERNSRPDAPIAPPAQSPAMSAVTITISGFAFDPAEVSVAAGSTVTWINDDDVTHNVFTTDELLASADLERSDTYSITVSDIAPIGYYCDIHQYMRGTITVTP